MYFYLLATNNDGTLATNGKVDAATVEGLVQLRSSGRRLVLVTGRELADLRKVFERIDLFDEIVVENSAVLVELATQLLAPAPIEAFVERLRAAGVEPLSVGRCIVATREPNQTVALEAIYELGLELQIIFNKDAVMVLPANVNKASGLLAALARLQLSPHNVVGVGDAQNDHAFLAACGWAVTVPNATPSLKEEADLVLTSARGAGVVELIDRLIENDLTDLPAALHQSIVLGKTVDDGPPSRPPCSSDLASRAFSSVWSIQRATMPSSRMRWWLAMRSSRHTEAVELLRRPDLNVVVNLLALDIADPPEFFARLQLELCRLRAETGRPHWLLIVEAHHMLPEDVSAHPPAGRVNARLYSWLSDKA